LNYLAHAYLSFGKPEILVGNMISDYVKGKKKFAYPPGIQHGILLHRYIDTYTDQHAATKKAKEVFRPHYRLYSGALIDVIYDHFLATDQAEFTEASLLDFSQQTFAILSDNIQWMPEPFAHFFPFMKRHNWLFNSRTFDGTAKNLNGVIRRAVYLTESDTAFRLFTEHYQLLGECYRHFWADVKTFAKNHIDQIQQNPDYNV